MEQLSDAPVSAELTGPALLPRIRVGDEWVEELPHDLYIPPDAFAVLLSYFEGPLDFLLYLVRRHGVNLIDIDIAPIAEQYLRYISLMQERDVELASDYLVMAALLVDMKSRLLLPKPATLAVEDDPRAELLDRLEKYAALKQGAAWLNARPVDDRNVFVAQAAVPEHFYHSSEPEPVLEVSLLSQALATLLSRPVIEHHAILAEPVLLEERLAVIRLRIQQEGSLPFRSLLNPHQGKLGLVVTFMAMLELIRLQEISVIQETPDCDPLISVWSAPLAYADTTSAAVPV